MESWRITGEVGPDEHAVQERMSRLLDQMRASGLDQEPVTVLAISGGGENGAYGG